VREREREREYPRLQIHQDGRFCGLFGTIKLQFSDCHIGRKRKMENRRQYRGLSIRNLIKITHKMRRMQIKPCPGVAIEINSAAAISTTFDAKSGP